MAEGSLIVAIRLTGPQVMTLRFIAERGGEIPWDWSACRPDATRMVRDLVDQKFVDDLPANRRIRLSDRGREAVSQIEQSMRSPAIIQSV